MGMKILPEIFVHGQGREKDYRTKKQYTLDIRKYSFSQRIVNEWNILLADYVGASSVNIFFLNIHIPKTGGDR